jgi:hypothetical protein
MLVRRVRRKQTESKSSPDIEGPTPNLRDSVAEARGTF